MNLTSSHSAFCLQLISLYLQSNGIHKINIRYFFGMFRVASILIFINQVAQLQQQC